MSSDAVVFHALNISVMKQKSSLDCRGKLLPGRSSRIDERLDNMRVMTLTTTHVTYMFSARQ